MYLTAALVIFSLIVRVKEAVTHAAVLFRFDLLVGCIDESAAGLKINGKTKIADSRDGQTSSIRGISTLHSVVLNKAWRLHAQGPTASKFLATVSIR